MMDTSRIDYLREQMLNASHAQYRVRRPLSILNGNGIEQKPVVVRKALAFELILQEMPIFIQDRELLVGGRTMFMPRRQDMQFWEDEDIKRNLEFLPDAETLAVESPGFEFYPRYATEAERALGREVEIGEGYVTSHCTAGYGNVLAQGFGGIKEHALNRLQAVPPDSDHAHFLNAVVICMDAATAFVQRYAEEARRRAAQTSDEAQREEFEALVQMCDHIQTYPARTFHEALQLFWFTHLFILIESYSLMAPGRLDQYFFPYYQRDLADGRLSREQALELLACLFIKMNDTSDLHTDNGLNIILSGLKPDGEDGTNDLTYLCFDAYELVNLTDPQINIRYHADTPQQLLDRAMAVKTLGPKPMVYNDHAVIEALLKVGVSLEDARNYCIDACQDVMVEGKSDFYPIFAGVYGIHLLTIMERIVDRLEEFSTFEEFWNALYDEITVDIKRYVDKANDADRILPKISPTPVLSSTLDGCVESGKDKTEGGTIYNFTGFVGGGLITVANSVAAIKKLVFEDQQVSAAELVEAIQRDYAHPQDESLRQRLKNKAPKWGNNDEYVDQIACDLADHFCTEVLKYDNPRGGRFVPGLFTHHQTRLGISARSTPDGRKKSEPLAMSLSPSIGTEKKGPTGAILSAAKIDQSKSPLGTSLDLTFYASSLQEPDGMEKLKALIKTYLKKGGIEFQVNTLDRKILRDAQQHPEQYRDLVVRVWGFNAYFVTLKPEYQEEIISRTEHA
ncbi:hypothetical protein GF339_15195 [candidate division KSB3 bacterium]|uniref:Formate C-acetyltransferase/glycerol dehydratase family glycyl radical enzyme n=1 Tax=candidate division KSB3 bacterium TaxID=2044937 RepID=A0A9D5JYA1_9BACT|nr:hypothetical protein [candidate division KSB3 bacterium]MBD3325931.1 hypothetical protein [candidate division KSB3 bacterium]